MREGKQTALVAEARALLPQADRARLDQVLGRAQASSAELAEVVQLLERSGVRARVEAQLSAYLDEARAALDGAPLMAAGVGMLDDLLARIGKRDH